MVRSLMSTVPAGSPSMQPCDPPRPVLAKVRKHGGQIVDIHPAVAIGVAGIVGGSGGDDKIGEHGGDVIGGGARHTADHDIERWAGPVVELLRRQQRPVEIHPDVNLAGGCCGLEHQSHLVVAAVGIRRRTSGEEPDPAACGHSRSVAVKVIFVGVHL